MEKLNANVVALSLGITTAVIYWACLIFVVILPLETIVTFGNYFVHGIDISSIATKNISLGRSIIGFVVVFASSLVTGYIFAFMYNWIGEKF